LLVQIAPNIGIDRASKAYSSIHTHDPSGIIHMESDRPHKFRLGDFFFIWGVRFGDESLGSLRNEGDKQVRVFVNGQAVKNANGYVMKDGDNISVGYGTADSFPHTPDKSPLKTVTGKGKQAACSEAGKKEDGQKGCIDESAK